MKMNINIIPIQELAKQLKKPQSTVYSWRRNGNLPESVFLKIGGCIFVKIDKFMEFINKETA